MTVREAWTQQVWRGLQQSGRPAPLRNVVERMSAVLAPDPVQFVDNGLAETGPGGASSGRICVFTERFVAVADADGVATLSGSVRATSTGAVKVRVVARSSLAGIAVVPGERPQVNSSEAWTSREARDGWPWDAQVSVEYPGLETPVLLPSGDPAGFGDLLPALLDNLASRA